MTTKTMPETKPVTHQFGHLFDRMKTAPNRERKLSPGPNPQIELDDWRATVNGTRNTLPTRRSVNQDPSPELVEATTITRFWRSVTVGLHGECWPWAGDTSNDGYGVFYYHGRMRGAHELALSFSTGEARHPNLDTCHECDNPPCCNPAHLRFDTRQSNVDDMRERDRAVYGSRSRFTKLTESQVLLMRERRARGARQVDLARDFDISVGAVSAIVRGQNWKHVGGPIANQSKKEVA